MLNNYMGLVILEKPLDDMNVLLENGHIGTLYIGGRYKIIDFPLSNLSNSGVTNIGILGDLKKGVSLVEHIGSGEPWDLDRRNSGVKFLSNVFGRTGERKNADLRHNLEHIYNSKEKYVVYVSSSMIYNVDFKEVFKVHESDDRDVTVMYKTVDSKNGKFYEATTLNMDEEGNVKSFGTNLMFGNEHNISMGVVIIEREKLISLIISEQEKGEYESLKSLIVNNLNSLKIKGYNYDGYLAQIKSIKEYYDFNLDLLYEPIAKALFSRDRQIYTKKKNTPSTVYRNSSEVENSLISNGCQIYGSVKNSILGRRVIIEEGAIVENCVLLQGAKIKKGSHIRSVIVDRGGVVKEYENLNSSPAYPIIVKGEKKMLI